METHHDLCNHLAPKLKGRPRGRRKKIRSDSPNSRQRYDSGCSDSGTSEISACSVEKVYFKYSPLYVKPDFKQGTQVLATRPKLRYNPRPARKTVQHDGHDKRIRRTTARSDSNSDANDQSDSATTKDEEFESSEEADFLEKLMSFHEEHDSHIQEMFWLSLKKVNLLAIYRRVQKLGGYEAVNEQKMWKYLFGVDGASANSIPRKKYERAILPFELFENEQRERNLQGSGRRRGRSAGTTDADIKNEQSDEINNKLVQIKQEPGDGYNKMEHTDRNLSVAEMTEIQRQIKAKDAKNHGKNQKLHVEMSSLPVTVIVGGSSMDNTNHSPPSSQIKIQQPHTTITVHQTTIHPQSFHLSSHCGTKSSSPNSLQQQIQITNQIQIQQITVQPNGAKQGASGNAASSSNYKGNVGNASASSESAKIYKRQTSVDEFSGRDGSGFIANTYHTKNGSRTSSLRHVRVRPDRSTECNTMGRKMYQPSGGFNDSTTMSSVGPNEKENIPYLAGSKTTTITPILGNSNKTLSRLHGATTAEVIDLVDSDNDSNNSNPAQDLNPFPNMKKRKLDILRQGGLEVTAISNMGGSVSGGSSSSTKSSNNDSTKYSGAVITTSATDSIVPVQVPRFQSRCMFTQTSQIFGNPKDQLPEQIPEAQINLLDLSVERTDEENKMSFIRLPESTTIQKANNLMLDMNAITGQKFPDPNLQITLVSPLTHVQNVHNSQNHNIKRKAEAISTTRHSATPDNKVRHHEQTSSPAPRAPKVQRQQPAPLLNIPTFPANNNDFKLNPFLLPSFLAPAAPSPRPTSNQSNQMNLHQPSMDAPGASNRIAADNDSETTAPSPNRFFPMLDPLYLSALYSNPNLILSQHIPQEILQLYKKFPQGLGVIPISKS